MACVDVSTVSRALNNTAYVHPETKKKVMEAVKQLSYQPNLLAKGLRQGKRHSIGIVVPSIALTLFGEISQRIEMEARKRNYGVMICHTKDEPEQEAACLNRLRNGLVDGIVIASTGQNTRLIRDIKASGLPVIQMIRAQDKTISGVTANFRQCAYEGVRYLLEKGAKQIGFINGDMEVSPFLERYKGYSKALQEARLPEYVSKAQSPRQAGFVDGYRGANYLLDVNPGLDCIITAVDMQGLGVLRALKERGCRVPQDVRVMSLSGHSIGSMLETTMTSMEIPAKPMGLAITQMMIEDIERQAGTEQPLRFEIFNAALMIRETT